LADAVVRELREETGLTGVVGPLCGVAERVDGAYHYVILDYWVDVPADEPTAAGDATDALWASRADLERLELVPRLVEFLTEHAVLAHVT
jgi:8-oxo-dGTP diphosphatase